MLDGNESLLYSCIQLYVFSWFKNKTQSVFPGFHISIFYQIFNVTYVCGSIPSSTGELKNMQVIRAGGNNNIEGLGYYTDQIPPKLGDYTDLQSIYMYENSLSGSIPSTLWAI
ncbi:hypothetical protein L1887_20892 [Cichorium endivia]|nr:hypothetical protein L1887_20892 [Cichorium endivia]